MSINTSVETSEDYYLSKNIEVIIKSAVNKSLKV